MPCEPLNDARLLWEVAARIIWDAVEQRNDAQRAIQDAVWMRAAARHARLAAFPQETWCMPPWDGFTRARCALLTILLDKTMIIVGADMGNIQLVDPTMRALQI